MYLVGPRVLVPGRELQNSDDLVDLATHLLKGEVTVLQGLLHTLAAGRLGCHKYFDTWNVKQNSQFTIQPNNTILNIKFAWCGPVSVLYVRLSVITWDEDGQQLFDCVHGVDQHHTVLLVGQLLLSLIYHLRHLRHSWTQATKKEVERIEN